jgi:hypothetical protein
VQKTAQRPSVAPLTGLKLPSRSVAGMKPLPPRNANGTPSGPGLNVDVKISSTPPCTFCMENRS